MAKNRKTPPPLNPPVPQEDPRPAGMFHIAWVSLAMLGMCIPLSPILGQFVPWTAPALPAMIIVSSILCSIAVWRSKERVLPEVNHPEPPIEIDALENDLLALSERLNALETIHAFEARTNSISHPAIADAPSPSPEERQPAETAVTA